MSRRLVAAVLFTALGAVPLATRGQAAPQRPGPGAPGAPEGASAAAAQGEELGTPSTSSEPGFRLYGFADVSYRNSLALLVEGASETTMALFGVPEKGSFAVGNLNLYLDGQLSARARSLAEVRFTYLPAGTQATTSPDYAHTLATTSWGGIVIERAWVEYAFSDLVTLRAGQFLTPFGIWNVDHGSPTVIGVQKPEVVSQELLPERQIGLEAYGSKYLGSARVGYHATVSNGRIGDNPPFANFSGRPGLGGRLFVEGDWLGELRLGVSGYTGRYTELVASDFPGLSDEVALEYDERGAAADLRWEWRSVLLLSEAVYQSVKYTDGGRPADVPFLGPPSGAAAADFWRTGLYVLAGYRLPYHVTPYLLLQLMYKSTDATSNGGSICPGVNLRALPNLVLKLQYDVVRYPDLPGSRTAQILRGQVAWAF